MLAYIQKYFTIHTFIWYITFLWYTC